MVFKMTISSYPKRIMIPESIYAISSSQIWSKLTILFVAYFTPIAEMVHVMLIFLAIDTIAGIWASLKEGNKLQSSKLRKTVFKFLWYTIAVMLAWMMEHTFKMSWSNLACLTAGFICFVELKSIFENITRITNEPIFRRILNLLKKKSSSSISEITGIDDDYTGDYQKHTESDEKFTVTHQKKTDNG